MLPARLARGTTTLHPNSIASKLQSWPSAADDERKFSGDRDHGTGAHMHKDARLCLIPASEETRGHPTTGFAIWEQDLQAFLAVTPKRGM